PRAALGLAGLLALPPPCGRARRLAAARGGARVSGPLRGDVVSRAGRRLPAQGASRCGPARAARGRPGFGTPAGDEREAVVRRWTPTCPLGEGRDPRRRGRRGARHRPTLDAAY